MGLRTRKDFASVHRLLVTEYYSSQCASSSPSALSPLSKSSRAPGFPRTRHVSGFFLHHFHSFRINKDTSSHSGIHMACCRPPKVSFRNPTCVSRTVKCISLVYSKTATAPPPRTCTYPVTRTLLPLALSSPWISVVDFPCPYLRPTTPAALGRHPFHEPWRCRTLRSGIRSALSLYFLGNRE